MSKSAFTDAYAYLVAALRELRLEKGVRQIELARRLGRPQQFVSYMESGVRRIDLVEFVVVVRALGGDPEKVFAKILVEIPVDTQV